MTCGRDGIQTTGERMLGKLGNHSLFVFTLGELERASWQTSSVQYLAFIKGILHVTFWFFNLLRRLT